MIKSGQQKTQNNSQSHLHLQQIQHAQSVRVLILAHQKILYQDFYFLKRFPCLIKLDVSYTCISSFPQHFTFTSFPSLKILFLHFNKFTQLKHLQILSQAKNLVYLTLFGNQLEQGIGRHFCVNLIKGLKVMDDRVVIEQERYQGIISHQSQIHKISFPILNIPDNITTNQYLANVLLQINIAKDLYLKANPLVRIQRWFRKYQRNKYHSNNQIKSQQIKQVQPDKQSKAQNSVLIKKNQKQQFIAIDIIEDNKIRQNIETVQQEQQQIYQKEGQNLPKIVGLLQYLHSGLNSLILLLSNQPTVFSTQSFCVANKVPFSKTFTFSQKHIHLFRQPQQTQNYQLQIESNKKFLGMVFYNNKFWKVELKRKRMGQGLVRIQMNMKQLQQLVKKEYIQINRCKAKGQIRQWPFLFGYYVVKISAALKIQKIWRGFRQRAKFNGLQIARERIAARKIIKAIRRAKFQHRKKFLLNLYSFLKNNESHSISIKMSTFSQLVQIYQDCMKQGKYYKLPFQEIGVQISQQSKVIDNFGEVGQNLNKYKKSTITLHSQRQPLPSYFMNLLPPFVLHPPSNQSLIANPSILIDLLVKGSLSIKTLTHQKRQPQVIFTYSSKAQASMRKALICLLTYKFGKKGWVKFGVDQAAGKTKDFNHKIKQGNFVKMVFDNNRSENLYQKIMIYTQQANKVKDMFWNPLKVRYFEGVIDYSAILIIGKFQKQFQDQPQSPHKLQKQVSLGLSSQQKQLLKSIDTHLHSPRCSSLFNSKILSFPIQSSSQQSYQSINNSRYSLNKSINNDGSIINDVSILGSQGGRSIFGEDIQEKRGRIQKINKGHKAKLELIEENRLRKTEDLREKYNMMKQQNGKLMRESSNASLIQNIAKVKKSKQEQLKINSNRQSSKQFQSLFIRKGNLSMKQQIRNFQKSRTQIIVSKSSRYQPTNSSPPKHLSPKPSHHKILSTQLKQFSIQLSQQDDIYGLELRKSRDSLRDGKSKRLANEKISIIYQQKMLKFKSQQSQDFRESQKQYSQSYLLNNQSQITQTKQIKRNNQEKNKMLKKKKMVHSVFPQEFYPLKDSQQIGFHLPKINNHRN